MLVPGSCVGATVVETVTPGSENVRSFDPTVEMSTLRPAVAARSTSRYVVWRCVESISCGVVGSGSCSPEARFCAVQLPAIGARVIVPAASGEEWTQ